jgi:hypothetical protein
MSAIASFTLMPKTALDGLRPQQHRRRVGWVDPKMYTKELLPGFRLPISQIFGG